MYLVTAFVPSLTSRVACSPGNNNLVIVLNFPTRNGRPFVRIVDKAVHNSLREMAAPGETCLNTINVKCITFYPRAILFWLFEILF